MKLLKVLCLVLTVSLLFAACSKKTTDNTDGNGDDDTSIYADGETENNTVGTTGSSDGGGSSGSSSGGSSGSSSGSSGSSGGSSGNQTVAKPYSKPSNVLTVNEYRGQVEKLLTGANFTTASTEYLSGIDKLGNDLMNSIIYSNTDITSCSGTKYYISNKGNDKNDGQSPDKAWATLNKLKTASLKSGDLVLLDRGSIWYGSLPCVNGVTYSAYGEGFKPRIANSVNGKSSSWVSTGTANVWRYSGDIKYIGDVGVVVYDDGKSYGEQKKKISLLTRQGDFVYTGKYSEESSKNNELYIYSVKNPNEQYGQIDISLTGSVLKMSGNAQNITVNNLELLYGQDYYFLTNPKNIVISDCVFGWQGGQTQASSNVRYGGGGGAWLSCDNLVFDHCYMYQQFDCAVTPQYSGTNNNNTSIFNKFTVKNCLIENAEYGIEYFTTQKDNDNNKITDMYLGYNFFRKIGNGFGNKPTRSSCIKSWEHENTTYNSVIEYNIFDRPLTMAIEITGKKQVNGVVSYDNSLIPNIRKNLYIGRKDKSFCKVNGVTYSLNEQSYNNLNNAGIETGSLYVYAK